MPRDRPALRMIVGNGGSLRPADAYSEQNMMRYPVGREIEVRPIVDLTYWKRRRYFQILDLVMERCNTPWKTADEAHDVLKIACGITKLSVHPRGKELVYAGTTTELEDPEFDDFYEGAMAWLYETTGVDPETLEKEAGEAQEDDSPEGAQQTFPGEEGDGSSPGPPSPAAVADQAPVMRHENIVGSIEADERALVNSADQMSTAALKQEAIQKIIDLALELKAQTEPVLAAEQITATMADARATWVKKMPGHPEFVKSVFEAAAKVMRGEWPRPAAQKYLFSLKDG